MKKPAREPKQSRIGLGVFTQRSLVLRSWRSGDFFAGARHASVGDHLVEHTHWNHGFLQYFLTTAIAGNDHTNLFNGSSHALQRSAQPVSTPSGHETFVGSGKWLPNELFADDFFHDFRCTPVDRGYPGVDIGTANWVLHHVAVSAV